MNSREAFENVVYKNKWNIFKNPKTGEYADDFVNVAWWAWQEQQKRIDEALKILDGMRHNGAHRAIKALKGGEQ